MISTQFCPICGAANETTNSQCYACGHHLLPESDQEDLLQHDLLFGRYQLLTILGSGGFSSVYQARDKQTDMTVAIKQINLRGLNAEEMIDATTTFNREASVLSTLNHHQVPRLYNQYQDRDHWYLVLEYFDGPTLETYLERRLAQGNPIRFDEAISMSLQLCAVLDHLHTRQPPIVYRDLKPGNIIRDTSGKLSLVDFGIARNFRPGQSRDTQLLGSPGYAAPEQYGRAQTSPQSDIYSLGVLLYALLSQSDPGSCAPDLSALDLSQHTGGAAMYDLLTRLLAVDPANRPASVREVITALEAIGPRGLAPQNARRIWIPPTPQTYSAASGMQQQLFIPPQPVQVALPKKKSRVSRRSVIIGLGVLVTSAGVGLSLKSLAAFVTPTPVSKPTPILIYDKHLTPVSGIAWSTALQLIASCSQNTVRVWDINGDDAFVYSSSDGNDFNGVAWSPDGLHLALASNKMGVVVLNTSTGFVSTNYLQHAGQVNGVAWSPDGSRIASADNDKTVQVWDAFSGNLLATYQATAGDFSTAEQVVVRAVAWSLDGACLASCTSDGIVRTWDALTGAMFISFDYDTGQSANAIAWSPDNLHIATASDNGTVYILLNSLPGVTPFVFTGHTTRVTAVAWSPDGRRIASADARGIILVWDAYTGKNAVTYTDSPHGVSALAWSPDGQYLASGSQDQTVKIWQVS
ncbi:MAG TPA: serine/threonine-protein kinase [Ktedonobacteraceae bacterium]|nr:serine/threonine-protein kinase [Ktedonobacteraceae bacterium]